MNKVFRMFGLFLCLFGLELTNGIRGESNIVNEEDTNRTTQLQTFAGPRHTVNLSTKQDLLNVINSGSIHEDTDYYLKNDIDLENTKITNPVEIDTSNFYGCGKVIKNINIDVDGANNHYDYCGFFGIMRQSTIQDLTLENYSFQSLDCEYNGSVAGLAVDSSLTNVSVIGANTTYAMDVIYDEDNPNINYPNVIGGLIGSVQDSFSMTFCSLAGFNKNTSFGVKLNSSNETESKYGGLIGCFSANYNNPVISHCSTITNLTMDNESQTSALIHISPTIEDFKTNNANGHYYYFYDNSCVITNASSTCNNNYFSLGGNSFITQNGSHYGFYHNYVFFYIGNAYFTGFDYSLYTYAADSSHDMVFKDNFVYMTNSNNSKISSNDFILGTDCDTLNKAIAKKVGTTTSAFDFYEDSVGKDYITGKGCYYWEKVKNGSTLVSLRPYKVYVDPEPLPDPITSYNVTFNSNRSDVNNVTTAFDSGTLITPPEMTLYNGLLYVDAWYFDKECTSIVDLSTYEVSSDITLYAHWTSRKIEFPHPVYKVTYVTDGGVIEASGSQEKWNKMSNNSSEEATTEEFTYVKDYQTGDKVILPNKVTKDGYIFIGWYLDSRLNTKGPIEELSIFAQGDLTLYAKYIKDDLKSDEVYVNLMINLIDPIYISGVYKVNDTITLPINLTQDNYKVNGYKTSLFSDVIVNEYKVTKDNHIGTLYPMWSNK